VPLITLILASWLVLGAETGSLFRIVPAPIIQLRRAGVPVPGGLLHALELSFVLAAACGFDREGVAPAALRDTRKEL